MKSTWVVSAIIGLVALAAIAMFAQSIYRQWKSGKQLSLVETTLTVAELPAMTTGRVTV